MKSFPKRPLVHEMRNRRPDLVRAISTGVVDLAIVGAVCLEERNVAGRATHRLRDGVDRLDGVVQSVVETGIVADAVICVHRRRVRCNGGKGRAQHRIAGEHVAEASAVAVAGGEDPSGVDTVARSQVCDQCLHEANVINVGIRPAV